ncbi:MAG: efflux RND transporter periplasmic adaptor subunit [Desulfobacterales bacterium]|nr:efflux RND transporter periplasmic adaptor subunit [Desulfobacterales bacterium]
MKKRLLLPAFVLLMVAVGGLVLWGQRSRRGAELYYSGTIEATQSNVAFQISGRVRSVVADEGRRVQPGELLAVVDREEFDAQREQARAGLRRAEEQVKQAEIVLEVNRRVLPVEVERAAAAVEALQAQLAQAESGFRVQEVERARLAVEAAQAARDNARREKERNDALFQKGVVAERTRDNAELAFQTALKEHGRAREAYRLAQEGSRREEIETARSRLAEGQAALRLAQSNLQKIQAFEQEVEAARAQAASARAALNLADIQVAYTELRAPFAGVVVNRNVEPGEVVAPGREVFSIADLSVVDLKVFVGEPEIGKVRPGQPVDVKIDTFPEKTYAGQVAFISPQAEFTPKIIQTQKERVKLVYLVKISVPNPNSELKSGMPADAWFR